ncbi:MAG: substrate-binding domain-containing protein [Flavisolibacter sp.]
MIAISAGFKAKVCMSHNKGRRFFFLVIFIISLFSSCAVNNKDKKYRVGFSQCTMVNKWRQTMLEEMQRELAFHPEVDFIIRDASGDTRKQIDQIKELIDKKVDLLIVSPNEAQPITPIVEKAMGNNIRVIIVDRRTSSQNYSAYVGASNYEVGEDAASFANSFLKGKGKVMEVSDIPGSSADIDRHKGFLDLISTYSGIKYLNKVYLEGDVNPSGEKLAKFLQSVPDINLIFAQNDRLALSASRVCKEMGLDQKISIIGVDGLVGANGGIDLVEKGILKATILYPTGGGEAILTAIAMLENKPFKKENGLMATIIDSSNVRIMKLQLEKMLAQQKDIDRRQRKIEEQSVIANNQANIIVAISITLALALILGGILFYYLKENKKIYKKLELQKNEISNQRNQLIEMVAKVKEATDAKFNFFTNISHELRTPLTLILGPLEDALSSPKLHFTIKKNLDFVHRNSIRLLRLINQLMDFRKIEENKMKLNATENNITEFVTDITNAFSDIARKKFISFNVTSKVKDVNLWFDVTMLDKVLFNLLSNAFKFTPEYGRISVIVDKANEDNMVSIRIEDTGIGMTTEDIKHAFEIFYQGHSANFQGTGLGLSLSKELINLHHGIITVSSSKGIGTTFMVLLPLGKEHLRPDEIFSEKPPLINTYENIKIYTTDIQPIIRQNENIGIPKENSILIIEDNFDLREFLRNLLGENYEIYVADNGENGKALAFDIIPDLIISDIVLPGQSGMQITETLKHDIRTSHIPIILLTAKGSMEQQIAGIKLRADAYIVKPFNIEYLEETIKSLLNGRALLREHYTSELPIETRSHSPSKIDRKFISEFTAVIENNISNEEFSIDDICKTIGISRVQLYRKVKALIGYNVNDYILTVRLQKAKFLLANEDLSISEIAYKVGFSAQAYFSTVFKSKFSLTPSDYRDSKKPTKL